MAKNVLSHHVQGIVHTGKKTCGVFVHSLIVLVTSAVFGVVSLFPTLGTSVAQASVPRILNYQLRLTDSNGIPVADGTKNIKISFYDAASGGSLLHTDCGTVGTPVAREVVFTNGVGSVLIGDVAAGASTDCADASAPNAIPADLFTNTTLFLGITVASDSEMTPRKRVVASGFALNADRLDDLDSSAAGGTTAFVPVTDSAGLFTLTGNPTTTAAVITANPVAAANELLMDLKNNGTSAFSVDGEGDVIMTGTLTINNAGDTGAVLVEGTNLDINSLDFVGAGSITAAVNTALTLNVNAGNAAGEDLIITANNLTLLATGALSITPDASLTTAIDLTDTDLTNALSIGANDIIGTAAAIDFSEFDVSSTTGSITINDGGDAGAVSVEGTVLDINSLDFVGAGAFTTAAAGAITFTPNAGGDVIIDTDSDTTLILNGGGDGVDSLVLTDGDILVSDGDVDISGGDFNLTLDAADDANIAKTAAAAASEEGLEIDFTAGAGNGSDVYRGLVLDVASANHAASSDLVIGLDIDALASADAEGVETAIRIGSGWDAALVVNGVTIVDGTGSFALNCTDCLDFDDLEDTLDLDAALTLNQTTNTWSQTFTGDTTTGFTYTANSLTTGKAIAIASSGASQTTDTFLDLAQTGVTTGYTGNLVNITSSSTTGAAKFLNITANASTVGTGANISMTALTSGTGLAITGGSAMATNGELINADMGAATAGNGIAITTTGVYTGTGLATLTANSATSGKGIDISMTGLTTGNALDITGGGANMQASGEVVNISMGAATVGKGIALITTGVYTGAGVLQVAANSGTTGTVVDLTMSGQTTGRVLQLTGGGANMQAAGRVISADMDAATVGTGIIALTTGVYTGTGVLVVNADAATTGTGLHVSMDGITSGTGIRFDGVGTAMTTGGELIDAHMGAATAGNGIAITTTGVYTGTGLLTATANSATTGTGVAVSMTGLTTGKALSITTTSAHNADVAAGISPNLLTTTFSHTTTALTSGGGFNSLRINHNQTPTVAGNAENLLMIQNRVTANTTDNAVSSGILIDNADTTASGSTVFTDAIAITVSGAIANGIVDAIDASDTNITNAINVGTNVIAITTGTIGSNGATVIDFAEFDVSGTTGGITIDDGGNAGALLVEGTNLDINDLTFVGAGTVAATSASLTLGVGTTTTLIVTTDSTGDGEVQLPSQSIGAAEIVDNAITGGDTADDTFDFVDFEDTLDLDAALTLNQSTNTWSQTFAGTTTTGLTYTASSLTSGKALALVTTNTHTADVAGGIAANSITSTFTQGTAAQTSGGGFNTLRINHNQTPTIAGNTENLVMIQNQVTANTTDVAVSSAILIDNADTTASGSTVFTDAIAITVSGAIGNGIVDAIDASDTNITNAINVGTNIVAITTGTIGSNGATVIDFAEFDVSGSTGTVTIDDSGNAGALLVEGTNLDINDLTFVGAGTVAATSASLTLGVGTTTALIVTTDSTGDAEVQLPSQSIGAAEIVDNAITGGDTADDTFDFVDFEDTLDLDAALTLNQTTNTWSQTFTGDTTTGFTYTANSLTSGVGMSVASSSVTNGSLLLLNQSTSAFSGDLFGALSTAAGSGNFIGLSATAAFTGDFIEVSQSNATATGRVLFMNLDNGDVDNTVISLITDETTTSTTSADTVKFSLSGSGKLQSDFGYVAGEESATPTSYRRNTITTSASQALTLDISAGNAAGEDLIITANNIALLATGAMSITPDASLTTAIDLTDTDLTNALSIGANDIIGTAAAIDFSEFDVSSTTGSVTINDGGDAGALLVEGTNLDINDLTFVGAGAIASGAATTLSINSGTTGQIDIGSDSSDEFIAIGGGAGDKTINIGSSIGNGLIQLISGASGIFMSTTATTLDGLTMFMSTTTADAILLAANAVTTGTGYTSSTTGLTTGSAMNLTSTHTATADQTGTTLDNFGGLVLNETFVQTTTAQTTEPGFAAGRINFTQDTAVAGNVESLMLLQNMSNAGTSSDLLVNAGLRINNADDTTGDDIVMENGVLVTVSGAIADGIIDAIDASDANITNALNAGANVILGTTAAIDFTNFDVATTGTITLASGQGLNTSGTSLNLGNVGSTSVVICNSTTCDTVSIGTTADADTITIGDTSKLDTIAITGDTITLTADNAAVGITLNADDYTSGIGVELTADGLMDGDAMQIGHIVSTTRALTGNLLDVANTVTYVDALGENDTGNNIDSNRAITIDAATFTDDVTGANTVLSDTFTMTDATDGTGSVISGGVLSVTRAGSVASGERLDVTGTLADFTDGDMSGAGTLNHSANVVAITQSETTNTGNALVVTQSAATATGISVAGNAITTGLGATISVTGLSSGSGVRVTGGTSMTTNGELLDLDMGAATAGNGLRLITSGVYTGTGLATITANSASTGTGILMSMTGLTTGTAISLTTTNTHNANVAGGNNANLIAATFAQSTTAQTSTNGFAALRLNYTQSATVTGNTENMLILQNQSRTSSISTPDLNIAAGLLIDNADTATGDDIVMDNGILISVSGALAAGIVDAVDASDTNITNALNAGDNVILGTTAAIDFTNFDVSTTGIIDGTNVTVSPSATVGYDTNAAGALSLGNTTATSVNLCASAACDTLTIGDLADNTVTINGTTLALNTSDWDISTTGVMTGIGAFTSDGAMDVNSTLTINTAGDQGQGLCHSGVDGATTNITLGDCPLNAADFAEYSVVLDPEAEPGDLISTVGTDDPLNPTHTLRTLSKLSYQANVDGIISTNPYRDILGDRQYKHLEGAQPIVLVGRSPVKVSLENGPIAKGDALVSSSTPGAAMKADPLKKAYIIGFAEEAYDGSVRISPYVLEQEELANRFRTNGTEYNSDPSKWPDNVGKIMTTMRLMYYDPAVYVPADSDVSEMALGGLDTDLSGLDQSLLLTDGLPGFGSTWQIDQTGRLLVKEVVAEKVTTKQVAIEQTNDSASMGEGMIEAGRNDVVVENPLVTPKSRIFVTFLGNLQGNWWIDHRADGLFQIKLSGTSPDNIKFEYWIVDVVDNRVEVIEEEEEVPVEEVVTAPSPDDGSTNDSVVPEPEPTPEPVVESSEEELVVVPEPAPEPVPEPEPTPEPVVESSEEELVVVPEPAPEPVPEPEPTPEPDTSSAIELSTVAAE